MYEQQHVAVGLGNAHFISVLFARCRPTQPRCGAARAAAAALRLLLMQFAD